MKNWLICLITLFSQVLFAQQQYSSKHDDCRRMVIHGDSIVKAKGKDSYKHALSKYNAAKACDEALTKEVNDKILALFNAVENEKNEAVRQRERAEKQTRIAEERREEAERQAEAARLAANAIEESKQDHTLALNLLNYSCKISKNTNEFALRASQNLIDDSRIYFYEKVLIGHSASVNSVAVSYNFIATGSEDGNCKLWDFDGKEIQSFYCNQSAIKAVAISPDGKFLLTGGADGSVKLWDTIGKEVFTLNSHKSPITSLIFTYDGKYIVTGSFDAKVKIWSIEDGKELRSLKSEGGPVLSLAVTIDNKLIAAGCGSMLRNDNYATLWDIEGNKLNTYSDDGRVITNVSFTQDGKSLITGSRSMNLSHSNVIVWDLNGKIIQSYPVSSGVESLLSTGRGRFVYVGLFDQSIKKIDLSSRDLISLAGHFGIVNSIASYGFNDEKILTASDDKTVKLWNLKEDLSDRISTSRLGRLSYHNKKKYFLHSEKDSLVFISNFRETKEIVLKKQKIVITSVAISRCSDYLLVGGNGGFLRLLSKKGLLEKSLSGHRGNISSLAFSDDGEMIISSSQDSTMRIWDTNGNLKETFFERAGAINSLEISKNNNIILSGSSDGVVHLRDFRNKKDISLKCHDGGVNVVIFSPDNNFFLTAGNDKTIRIWDLKGKEINRLNKHNSFVNSLEFSDDGKWLLSCSNDGVALLWSAENMKMKYPIQSFNNAKWYFFSVTGDSIIGVTSDGRIKIHYNEIFLLEKGKIAPLSLADKVQFNVAWTPDEYTKSSDPVRIQEYAFWLVNEAEQIMTIGKSEIGTARNGSDEEYRKKLYQARTLYEQLGQSWNVEKIDRLLKQ